MKNDKMGLFDHVWVLRIVSWYWQSYCLYTLLAAKAAIRVSHHKTVKILR